MSVISFKRVFLVLGGLMGICIDVAVPRGDGRKDNRTGRSVNVPAFTLSISLEPNGEWRLLAPISPNWSTVVPDGFGLWQGSLIDIFYIMDKSKNVLLELRETERHGRLAFMWPKKGEGFMAGTIYEGEGKWRPSQNVQTHAWIGIVGKGSLGAGLSGEISGGGLKDLTTFSQTVFFAQSSGRLGAVLGGSVGVGLLFATGFRSPRDFDGYTSSGWDYSVAVGTRLKGVLNPNLSKIARVLDGFDNKLAGIETFLKGANPKYQELRNELPNIAKTVKDAVLVDPDVRSMVCIDLPGTPGAEIGVFYKWDRLDVRGSFG